MKKGDVDKGGMKKRNIIFIIVGILIVLMVVLFLFVLKPKELSEKDILKNPSVILDFCSKSSGEKSDNCYFKLAEVLAANNTDISLQACSSISNDALKKNCLEQLASKEENPTKVLEICNKIIDDNDLKQHCYGMIDTNSGNLSIDTLLTMCDVRTGRDKDDCYRNIADGLWETSPLKAVEICQKILSSEKNNCLNNFMSSPELIKANPDIAETICSSSSLTMKSNCYNNFARALSAVDPKKAAEVCKELSDEVQISDCYGMAWFSFDSIIAQNYDFAISLCNVLTLKKDDCLRRTMQVFMNSDRTKAKAICKLMSSSASSECLNEVK